MSENKLPHIYSTCDPKFRLLNCTETSISIQNQKSTSANLKIKPSVYCKQIKLITLFRLGAAFGMKTNSGTTALDRLFWLAGEQ